MSLHFYPLKIAKIVKETEDSSSLLFELSKSDRKKYKFEAGQYLNVRITVNGNEERRSYSIFTSPSSKELGVAIKRVKDGIVSNHIIDNLKEGDSIEVMPPAGHFTIEKPKKVSEVVFFAAGSGITPQMSLIQDVLDRTKKTAVQLHYGNRSESSIIFKNSLSELVSKNSKRFDVSHYLTNAPENWGGNTGRIDVSACKAVIESLASPKEALFFICGPELMMESLEVTLVAAGIDKSNIHIEHFLHAKQEATVQSNNTEQDIQVILDGETYPIYVKEGESILDAVMDAKLDPPYSCQSGICTTCMAKLVSGTVEMEEDLGLSEHDKEEGYILTCQAHPTSKEVVVEYE
jgi:ring-1,2-phenylacetyl-CoA epoxidase subunit PaaE